MNQGRYLHEQTLLSDGEILITGGGFNIGAELFDPTTGTFASLVGVSPGAYSTATNLQDDRVLIAGGQTIDPTTAEIFDPVTSTSVPTATQLVQPRFAHTATLLGNGEVLLCGGESAGAILDTAELFDPMTKTFAPVLSHLSGGRYSHTATLLPNGKVLIAGGFNTLSTIVNSAELFDPVTGNFTPISSASRYGHTATLLPNGKVLIAGGWNGAASTASAEIFDPELLTFTPLASSMISARGGHTATLLLNGQVLITGGRDANSNALNTAELFDPVSNSFTTLDPFQMNSPRWLHCAELLQDGRVLVSGGYIGPTVSMNSAEVFTCPPVFSGIANITAEAIGPNGTTVAFALPISKDFSGQDLSVNSTVPSGTMFPLGATSVSFSAVDSNGITTTANMTVTITDTTAPAIAVPPNITVLKQRGVKRNRKAGAIVTFTIGAVDLVDGAVTPTAIPSSGSFFPIGDTTVQVTAIDSHGNQSSENFVITVTKKRRQR